MKNNLNLISQDLLQNESQLDLKMRQRAQKSRQKRASEKNSGEGNENSGTQVLSQNLFSHPSSAFSRFSNRKSFAPKKQKNYFQKCNSLIKQIFFIFQNFFI